MEEVQKQEGQHKGQAAAGRLKCHKLIVIVILNLTSSGSAAQADQASELSLESVCLSSAASYVAATH